MACHASSSSSPRNIGSQGLLTCTLCGSNKQEEDCVMVLAAAGTGIAFMSTSYYYCVSNSQQQHPQDYWRVGSIIAKDEAQLCVWFLLLNLASSSRAAPLLLFSPLAALAIASLGGWFFFPGCPLPSRSYRCLMDDTVANWTMNLGLMKLLPAQAFMVTWWWIYLLFIHP